VNFEFLTVLLLRINVFWDVMRCELINSYQFFEGTLVNLYKSTWLNIQERLNLQFVQYIN